MAGENELLNTVFVYGLGYLSSWIIIPQIINHVLSYFQLNRERGPEEKDLGKWIGIIERTLIMTFLFKGYIQLISLLIGMKSIIRFPNVQEGDKQFAEYFLIGSLLSLGSAMVLAEMTNIYFVFFNA